MSEENGPIEGAETIVATEADVSTPEPQAEPVERSKSTSESLERALKQLGERNEKPATDDRPRTPDGKFAPKPDTASEQAAQPPLPPVEPEPAEPEAPPPARLRDDVKASWKDLPPNVRHDFTRITGELEKGLTQYRETLEPFKPFLDRAKQTGTDPVAAIRNYMGIEDQLRANPINGLETICRNMGTDLRTVAAHVMGQPAPERDAQVSQLRQELAQAQAQVQSLTTYKEKADAKAQAETLKTVEDFAAKHPRFDELSGHMTWLLQAGAPDLATAYRMAELASPAPAAQTRAPAAQTGTPAPQTSKAGLSLDGAPGSNAQTVVKSKSNDEALRRAAAKVGLSL